jgi:solute carrier family 13 (sodium-dependent dicarboxylate transporter), member 2/3/5
MSASSSRSSIAHRSIAGSRSTWRDFWILLGAVALLAGIIALPVPAPLQRGDTTIPLTAEGKACLAIMAFAVLLWITESLPFAVTALVALLLVPLFGIADFSSVVQTGFGDPVLLFFIGVLALSSAFTRSGLGQRLVYHILLRVGTRTDRVLLAFLVVGTLISMWVTNMAVAAMLLPLGVGLLKDSNLQPGHSNFGRALMISTAFSALIGGIATPAGTAANIVALAQLEKLAHIEISFTSWMLLGVPASLIMVPFAWRLLLWCFPPEITHLPLSAETIRARLDALGPIRAAERNTLLIFGATIALWLGTPLLESWTDGRFAPPIQGVALAGGLALFLPKIDALTWKEAERDIEWGGLMLIAAGMSLGLAAFESGAARWLAWVLLGQLTLLPHAIQPFVIVIAVAILHLMFASNTVTASIVIPIVIVLAQDLKLDVWWVVAPAAFTSSLAFVLVSQGPTTVIAYSSGHFAIGDMAKVGIWMTLVAALSVSVAMSVLL